MCHTACMDLSLQPCHLTDVQGTLLSALIANNGDGVGSRRCTTGNLLDNTPLIKCVCEFWLSARPTKAVTQWNCSLQSKGKWELVFVVASASTEAIFSDAFGNG